MSLSVRKWIREGRATLFLPYRANDVASLRSVISTRMRLAIFETMNLEEGNHRLWFVVCELDALGAIDGLKDALARLRKFDGRSALGFQSIGQVRGAYGDTEAQTIIENCGNSLILRCLASERGGTAELASRIDKREGIRQQISRTRPNVLLSSVAGSVRSGSRCVWCSRTSVPCSINVNRFGAETSRRLSGYWGRSDDLTWPGKSGA